MSAAVSLLAVGLGFVLAPLWAYLLAVLHQWWSTHESDSAESPGDAINLPALITGQLTTESRTSITQSPDPTSVEFESVFRRLCDDALENLQHRLVLVVDNLDRVSPEHALAVWATLQTFLQYSEHERPDWFQRFWVVVPFDKDGIQKLWANDREELKELDDGGRAGKQSVTVADSFLDKTFQVRFQIPPPAISDWRSYLSAALATALPDHSEGDFHGVYRAFALREGLESASPKPRDLKLFVNEIGAVHRQWQHEDGLSLSDYAVFVLLQRDGVTETTLLSTEIGDDGLFAERLIGHRWRDTLARLYFNAPLVHARQMLLREPIEAALGSGNGGALRELEEIHSEGFWGVFEDCVPAGGSTWGAINADDLSRAATALDISGLFEATPLRREAQSIQGYVRAAATEMDTWPPFTAETATVLVSLCRITGSDLEFAETLTAAASAGDFQQNADDLDDTREVPLTWMRAAHVLIEGLDGFGLSPLLKVPLSSEEWLEVVPQLQGDSWAGNWWGRLQIQSIEDVDALLAERVGPGQIDEIGVAIVDLTLRTESSGALTSTANTLVDSLQSGIPMDARQIALTLRALNPCRSANLVGDETFESLAFQGYLLHHLHQASAESHAEAIARCALAYLVSRPDAREPNEHYGDSQAGYEQLAGVLREPGTVPAVSERFADLVEEVGGLRVLSGIMDAEPIGGTLLNEAFAALLSRDSAAHDPAFIVQHWKKIRANLPEALDRDGVDSFREFLASSPSITEISAQIVAGAFQSDDAPLYLAVLSVGGEIELADWSAAGIRTVTTAIWTKSLTQNDDLVGLALDLQDRQQRVELGAGYLDALEAHSIASIDASVDAGIKDSLADLIGFLTPGNREILARRVYEALEDSQGRAEPIFFDLYGPLLASRNLLLGQSGFVDRVCRPLVVRANSRGIGWLADLLESEGDLLSNHDDRNATDHFRERVRAFPKSLDEGEEVPDTLHRLAAILGLELESPEAASNEQDIGDKDQE